MYLKEVKVKKAEMYDVMQIATLHMGVFTDYFLTSLGRSIVYEYYLSFFLDNNSEIYVAKYDHRVVSFIVITSSTQRVIKSLLKRRWKIIVKIIILKVFTLNRIFLKKIVGKVLRILKIVAEKNQKKSQKKNMSDFSPLLLVTNFMALVSQAF